MQANLKGGNALVRLLLAHGEKIGMAGIVVCAALLLWSAFGRERLGDDQDPEDLQQLASRADTHIKGFRWDAVDEENRLVAQPVSSETMKEIPRHQFPPYAHGFDRRLLEPIGLRTDPMLLTAEDLEVHGDSGLWAFSDAKTIERKQLQAIADEKRKKKERENNRQRGRGENPRGGPRGGGLYGGEAGAAGRGAAGRGGRVAKKGEAIVVPTRTGAQLQGFEQVKADSWVTLLAKVPIELQNQHYDDALQSARGYDPRRDVPIYRGYLVERAEVTDAGQGKWERIAKVSGKTIEKELDTYPVNLPDVIDPDYNHPVLTHPLPPLILREWGEQASHSSMPLLSERDKNMREEEEAKEGIEETTEEEDVFAGPSTPDRRGGRSGMRGSSRRGSPSRRAPMRGEGMRGGMRGGGEGMGMMEMGMEMGGGGGMGGRGMSTRRAGTSLASFTWDGITSHVLFRYFDNSAKPGRKYRYRVRLALSDVNHFSSGKNPNKNLDPTVAERRGKLKGSALTYRFTDWSEPSPIVSVPLPARIYLVSAKPTKETNFNAEPEIELLVKALNSEYAAEIARSDYFPRGSVINTYEKATVIWSNYKFTTEQNSEFDFRTGVTLLDFRGGEKLSNRNRDLTVPARAVLMDAAGRLFLQEEIEDTEPVAEYQQALEGGQDSRGNSRGGPGGLEGYGGEFGGEFGGF